MNQFIKSMKSFLFASKIFFEGLLFLYLISVPWRLVCSESLLTSLYYLFVQFFRKQGDLSFSSLNIIFLALFLQQFKTAIYLKYFSQLFPMVQPNKHTRSSLPLNHSIGPSKPILSTKTGRESPIFSVKLITTNFKRSPRS